MKTLSHALRLHPPTRTPAVPFKDAISVGDPERGDKAMVLRADGSITYADGSAIEDKPRFSFRSLMKPPGEVSDDYGPVRSLLNKGRFFSGIVSYASNAGVAGALLATHIPALMALGILGPLVQVAMQNGFDPIGTFLGGRASAKVDDDVPKALRKSEMVNCVGKAIQCALLAFPAAYVVAAPLGSVMQAYATSTRNAAQSAMDQHSAKQGQIAAIKGANTMQELVAVVAGLAVGGALGFIPLTLLGVSHVVALGAVPVAIGLNLFFNRKGSKALHMDNMTQPSIAKLLRTQLNTPDAVDQYRPESAAQSEFDLPKKQAPMSLGVSIKAMASDLPRYRELETLYGSSRYMIDFDGTTVKVGFRPTGHDALSEQALAATKVEAVYHGQLLREIVGSPGFAAARTSLGDQAANHLAVEMSLGAMPSDFAGTVSSLRTNGWDPSKVAIRSDNHSLDWAEGPPQTGKLGLDQVKAFMDQKLSVDEVRHALSGHQPVARA